MVDEIFDTSSDAVNMSYKYVVKETGVQTDIVWENINDLLKKQMTIKEPTSGAESFASKSPDTLPSKLLNPSERINDQLFLHKMQMTLVEQIKVAFNILI